MWFTLSAAFKLTSSTSLASTDGSADETDCPHFDVLKEGQTEYHHAIFIDQSIHMLSPHGSFDLIIMCVAYYHICLIICRSHIS